MVVSQLPVPVLNPHLYMGVIVVFFMLDLKVRKRSCTHGGNV